jgi:hypothetical protein
VAGSTNNPAKCLEGLELNGGWVVGPLLVRPPNSTGGTFSQIYRVKRKDGSHAFLKALDFVSAFSGSDFTVDVQRASELFNYEREILNVCQERRMDKIPVSFFIFCSDECCCQSHRITMLVAVRIALLLRTPAWVQTWVRVQHAF